MIAKKRIYILPGTSNLLEALKGTSFVEWPEIHVHREADFKLSEWEIVDRIGAERGVGGVGMRRWGPPTIESDIPVVERDRYMEEEGDDVDEDEDDAGEMMVGSSGTQLGLVEYASSSEEDDEEDVNGDIEGERSSSSDSLDGEEVDLSFLYPNRDTQKTA